MSLPELPNIRIGMAMWSHPGWKTLFPGMDAEARLAAYGRVFGTVEGNTSFYALPSAQQVNIWQRATPEDFRFTFKLPRRITHELSLRDCREEVLQFFQLFEPLMAKTGVWKIQLPARFGPESLPVLTQFLSLLPEGVGLGVEVRHRAFFAKGEAERDFNRLLMDKGINRIIMDTRPVFALPAINEAITDAHQKKPRVPVHPLATGANPVVRFIAQPHTPAAWGPGGKPADLDCANNQAFFAPWLGKLADWLAEGRSPYLFIHTPDNSDAPLLASELVAQLAAHLQALHPGLTLPSVMLESAESDGGQFGLGLQ
ncbi:DUF72 domain-containing protein [Shewanella zhangzhouensis]|uniref:DUF72 domain-containing protein n=1 Tax=Shewanella zhangzhouensis TaxID=2864213 RepID=UPI001C66168D|nr:DUF72 domain-containing protein [Shewanella zhangzhouensis]QYK04862.1 DUF72 domain-containing protein [Shewanella zhangzhouensis]